MSSFVAWISEIDWKRVVFFPWEKGLLGLTVLVVLCCLSGTRWSQTTKTPAELVDSVKQSESRLYENAWPEREQQRLRYDDLPSRVNQRFFTAIEPMRYRFPIPFSYKLYPWQDLADEPRWLPVQQLIATAGHFVMPLAVEFAPVEKGPAAADPERTFPVRGVRCVAIRGSIPWRAQLEQIVQALHIDNSREAAPLVEYLDFTLERQTAVAGRDPWVGEWKRQETQSAVDVLQEGQAIAAEIVPDEYLHPVCTMPLPAQFKREWGAVAGHPLIPPRRVDLPPVKFPGKAPAAPVIISDPPIRLFRFLDFTVEPGECYRYRVQLTLRNPNYDRSLNQLRNESIRLGETRVTPFCAPSAPVAVERDMRYYAVRAVRSRNFARNEAEFNVFQWDPKFGTTVNAPLKVAAGQRIGGKAKTQRLNVASSRLDLEEVLFTSSDTLVDSFRSPQLDPAEHNHPGWDVKRWKESADRGIFDQFIIVDRFGGLSGVDTISTKPELQLEEQRLQAERQQWLVQ